MPPVLSAQAKPTPRYLAILTELNIAGLALSIFAKDTEPKEKNVNIMVCKPD
jgi:hypothetical protein